MAISKPVILCVDDEILVLNSLKIQLKNEFGNAYLYEVAESADEAMEVIEELEATTTPILAIVSDWLMPGIKGDEFLIRVHQRYPHIIKVLLTGQVDDMVIERTKIEANLHSCLHKPWVKRELIEKIKSGLANL